MSAFLGEFGKRLAQMWVTVLVLPVLLFTGVVVIAGTLGHAHALDAGFLLSQADPAQPEPAQTDLALGPATLSVAGDFISGRAAGPGTIRNHLSVKEPTGSAVQSPASGKVPEQMATARTESDAKYGQGPLTTTAPPRRTPTHPDQLNAKRWPVDQ